MHTAEKMKRHCMSDESTCPSCPLCLGHKFHSMRILKTWFFSWKQRTSKYFTKEMVFFEVKCMSHMRLKRKIAPIHFYFLGGTHKAIPPLDQYKQHVKFPQAATLQNSPLAQIAVLFPLLTKGSDWYSPKCNGWRSRNLANRFQHKACPRNHVSWKHFSSVATSNLR